MEVNLKDEAAAGESHTEGGARIPSKGKAFLLRIFKEGEMTMLNLTQKELQNFVKNGNTHIWQYRTLYQIDYSPNIGNGEFYLRKIRRISGMGVTKRGRYIAMPSDEALYFLQA